MGSSEKLRASMDEQWAFGDGLPLRQPPLNLNLGGLSRRARLLFLATNLPYWVVALLVLSGGDVPAAPAAQCFGELCTSPNFHGPVLTMLAFVSTVWHGAQCELMEWLSCVDVASASRQRMLLRLDIGCSLGVSLIGIVCFGTWRTLFWLAAPVVLFALARRAKGRREYLRYAVLHGLWHIFSAAVIYQILFNIRTPPWQ